MTFQTIALVLLALVTPAFASGNALRARELTTCDSFKGCYLRNLQTGTETKLTGTDVYTVQASTNGYSIRCDVNIADSGEMDFLKFFYDNKVQDEFGEPRWMSGDAQAGGIVHSVPYLSTCGPKILRVEGHVWAFKCFDKTFHLDAKCTNDCNFVCPSNSVRIPGRTCYRSFDDCQCNTGFTKANGQCVRPPTKPPTKAPVRSPTNAPCPNFVCPTNSIRIPGRTCYRTFDDCQCNAGFVKSNNQCVSDCPNFVCPANSARIPGRTCYRSFDDCQCNTGFTKANGQCMRPPTKPPTKAPVRAPTNAPCPNFVCPTNSIRIPGLTCYRTFDDCQCNAGFVKSNNQCVSDCPNFVCPANSARIPGRTCYRSFDDCQCNTGFTKANGQCMRPPTKAPTKAPVKPPTKAPTKSPTNAPCPNFVCPTNSIRIPGRTCYRTFDDCQCNAGFVKSNNQCVSDCPNFVCPTNSARIPGRTCYRSFDDCQCNTGFTKANGQCVRPPTKAPTKAPVKPPTKAPTKSPTKVPVTPPTKAPTKRPTKAPTKAPVKPPTKSPTKAPVKPPSRAPTKRPTKSPTRPPTKSPTKAPTKPPVRPPTKPPTRVPTKAPCPNFVCPANSVRIPGRDCYRSFDDCQCSGGFKKENGQCVVDCPNFICPANSVRIPGRDCYRSFDDCECNQGFRKVNGQCVTDCPNFQCPSNSSPIWGRDCIRSFDDCACNHAYRKENGQCAFCKFFQCPANSYRIPGRACYTSFDDCECNQGFRKVNGQCVTDCPNFQCPSNAFPIWGRDCIRSFDDCECINAYRKEHGQCVSDCPNFQCPDNSYQIWGRDCYRSFDDCECNHGYYKEHGRCVKEEHNPCGEGRKELNGGVCVAEWCSSDWTCPWNAQPIHGKECFWNIWDCQCNDGFKQVWNECIEDGGGDGGVCGHGKKLINGHQCVAEWCSSDWVCPDHAQPIADRECFHSIWDCNCDHGYHRDGDSCVQDSGPCGAGKKLNGQGICVAEWCNSDFHCPHNSHPNQDRDCHWSLNDCNCDDGFVISWATNGCAPAH